MGERKGIDPLATPEKQWESMNKLLRDVRRAARDFVQLQTLDGTIIPMTGHVLTEDSARQLRTLSALLEKTEAARA